LFIARPDDISRHARPEEEVRALIVGLDSRIGSVLAATLRDRAIEVVGTSRRDSSNGKILFDLAQPDLTVLPKADIVFICAAQTSQALCRTNTAESNRINIEAPVAIAKAFSTKSARIVFTSSSAVFDGSKPFRPADDACCPISVYGEQKAEAERQLLALGRAVAILRLTKTLSIDFPLFRDWIAELRAGRLVRAFEDLVIAPLPAAYVAEALLAVATSADGGIFQVSGTRDISYVEAARQIAAQLSVDPAQIAPARAQSAGVPPNEIPMHTTLDNSRVTALIGPAVPDPFEVINEIVAFSIRTMPEHRANSLRSTGSSPVMPYREPPA
jgi:dTDP-4-dehydrorhamnose reductase